MCIFIALPFVSFDIPFSADLAHSVVHPQPSPLPLQFGGHRGHTWVDLQGAVPGTTTLSHPPACGFKKIDDFKFKKS
jgi:hypothetical protein